jgi:carboxymethylenebutenolidase
MRDTLNDMQLYLVDEFVEDYQEGLLSRRDALKRIAAISGSMAFATSLLAACGTPTTTTSATTAPATSVPATLPEATTAPTTAATTAAPTEASIEVTTAATTEASAAATTAANRPPATSGVTVPEDDPDISATMTEFPGEGGATLMGYMARPSGDGQFPVILVCHENRGLTPHIQDVTRRLAKAGYVGLAVDLLSRQGGMVGIGDADVPSLLGQLPEGQPVQDFQSGLAFLGTQPFADATKAGMVGFCYGGGVTWRVATKTPDLRAAVPFYGPAPAVADVPGIQAAVLAIYAEQDERINAGIPEIEAAMQQNGKTFEKVIYPGVNHAFHNDTAPRYNAEQAQAAWSRTLQWFEQYVKA